MSDIPDHYMLTWESQVVQFPEVLPRGTRGLVRRSVYADLKLGAVDKSRDDMFIDCFLWYVDGRLRGIGYYYARDIQPWEKKGNVNIFVDPEFRRKGIGTALVRAIRAEYNVNELQQRYSVSGRKFLESLRRNDV